MQRLWLVLAWTGLCSAATWVAPAIVNRTLDSGAHASSALKLRNTGAAAASITFELLPSSAAGPAEPVTQTLDPGATLVIANPLRALWSREEETGALKLTADQSLAITSETVVELPDGSQVRSAGLVGRYQDTTGPESTADLLSFPIPDSAAASLGVVFLVPGAVDVVSYNAAGAELVRQTLEAAAPGVVEVAAASLDAPGTETFRYEIQVASGRVSAYLQILDSALNDVLLAAGTPEPTGGPRVTYLAREAGSRVSVRILNPDEYYSSVITAAFYAPEGGDPLATAKVTLAAGAAQAIDDIVVETFGLAAGTPGILQLSASYPVVIQSRTLASAGHQALTLTAPAGSDPAQLIALDPAAALGFTANVEGGTASLTLLDAAGQSVAAGSVTLEPNTTIEAAAAAFFQVEAIPQGAAVVIETTQGALAAYARTGGTLVQSAQSVAEYSCEAPYVDHFTSSAGYPAAPGSYDLSWSVFNADTVSISGLGPVATTSTAAVDLTESATYELTATGVCGETVQQLNIAIGAPRLAALSPAEAKPGQTVTLTMENLAAPDAVTGALLTFPNGTTAVAQVNVENGVPVFTVPLPRDVGGVTGDYTGGISVAARLNDDTLTNTVGFTFLKSTYAGDAAADFRQWITSKAAAVRDVLTQLHDQPDLAPAIDVLLAGLDPDLAVLQKMADDIAVTGSAVLPAFPATAEYPNPQPVTVTRADLETMMSMITELTPAEEESPTAWKNRVRAAGEGGPCLTDDPKYALCYSIAQIDSNSLLVKAWNAAGGIVDEIGKFAEKFSKNPYIMAFNRIRRLVGKAEFFCNIYPVYLDSFNARPFPDPVPVGTFREVRNDGTRIYALLKSRWTKEQAVDQIVQVARNFVLDSIINGDKKTSKEGKDAAKEQARIWLDWLYQQSRDEVQRMSKQLGLIQPAREVQVYKCDLKTVQPQGLGRNPLLGRDTRIEPLFEGNKSYAYGFWGKEDGGLTYAQLTTFPDHFVELTPNVNAQQHRGVKGGVYGIPIEVGRGVSTLKVTLTRAEERGGTYRTLVEMYREFKVTPETRFDYSFATGKSSISMKVRKTGASYKIEASISGSDPVDVQPQGGMQLSAKLRRQRGNRQQFRFTGQASGTSDRGYAGASMYLQNDGSAANTSPRISYAFPPDLLNLSWNITSTGARSASISIGLLGGGRSSSANFHGTLTLPVP
ncbi:hypothetical protein [Paludibaculum fermentans]|uniref:hypothetical protein n=1 Tax=Paludibaculum fermentans TaxID=1473598 RepID=UPI003EBECBDF